MGSSIDLKQMQKIEFDILRTVHTLCQENHITYYLGYGTMLGAVRHQGFIPWDDDVDIVMPRDDYRRFLQLAPQYLPEHLKLCHLGNTAPYNYDFAKIQDKRTILIEDTYSYLGIESGLYIDIFSLDGYPADEKKRRRHHKTVYFWQQLLAMYFSDPHKKRSLWKRPIVFTVQHLLSQNWIAQRLDKVKSKYPTTRNAYIGYCEKPNRVIMPAAVYGTPTPCMFEGFEFNGVEQPDTYLRNLYGDYMSLPPEDQRTAHVHSVVRFRD